MKKCPYCSEEIHDEAAKCMHCGEWLKITQDADKYLFDAYMHEYSKHRDEVQNRINLQNGMAQRGINLTALAATLLVSLFTFIMKGTIEEAGLAFPQQKIDLFVALCIPVLLLHGILLQLTIAAWIYQLSMMFQITRYWNWIVREKIDNIIGTRSQAFLWDLIKNGPWVKGLDRFPVGYFQPAFLYALSLFAFIGVHISTFSTASTGICGAVNEVGLTFFKGLAVSLIILAVIHLFIVRNASIGRIDLPTTSNKTNEDEMP